MSSSKVKVSVRDFYLVTEEAHRGPNPTICHVRIIRTDSNIACVLSELKNNPGHSITNLAPRLQAEVDDVISERGYLDDIDNIPVWVEHYNDSVIYEDPKGQSRYDRILNLYSGGDVEWETLSKGKLENLCKEQSLPVDAFKIPTERLVCPEHLIRAAKKSGLNNQTSSARVNIILKGDNSGLPFDLEPSSFLL